MLARTPPDSLLTMADPLVVENLSVAYRGVPALQDVSWTAPVSGLAAIVGPNGAGKSTLVKAILGLVPSTGRVTVGTRPFEAVRDATAYVPQRASVDWDFPATALDVVLQGMVREAGWLRAYGRTRRDKALALLDQVGLADLATRQIGQMSGGQQQRVFLARGLARNARILFLDEPLAGVDAASERIILDVFDRLDRDGRLVICVHHDLGTVAERFAHVLVLNRRVIASGPVSQAFTPETLARAYGVPLAI
ncbi:metal ABC transporter ATP-binding protein [Phreatobacter sp.]|uniref:metal ABC transporter ATP-binding protein n=1 Tax=Phreatobacter sp. TaxID=1966341 RepID=UPI003F6E7B9D